jgi:Flp pilus assembly protein TadG
MKNRLKIFFTRSAKDQRGQVIPWMALMLVAFLSMSAFVVDVGHAFICYQQLQAATDAAALAGAYNLGNSTAVSVANSFGAIPGGYNAKTDLGTVTNVAGYPELECLATVTALGNPCIPPSNSNAIIVEEQAVIPTFFSKVFGVNSLTISAMSTGALAGPRAVTTNVAIIVDTTGSMNSTDTNCGGTRLACSLNGVATLLQTLSPCTVATGNCAVNGQGVSSTALDQVALFTFPNVNSTTTLNDYNCSGSSVTSDAYTFPPINGTSYSGTTYTSGKSSVTDTYEITNFLSNYRASDATTSLESNTQLTNAVGAAGCGSAMKTPSGVQNTYYAGVIYAAQDALTQMFNQENGSTVNPTPQNIMIILTDGEANSNSFNTSAAANGAGNPAFSTTSGTYPSSRDQCQQAVAAADYAKSQGTYIYTVAYGSESSGCTTDSTNSPPVNIKNITPCQVMSMMATSSKYFYSDYNQSGSSSTCVASNPETSLSNIFTAIGRNFLNTRLVPNGST